MDKKVKQRLKNNLKLDIKRKYHLNMRLERILPHDLLDIAKKNGLAGVKIHVLDGESQSLGQLDEQGLLFFKNKAAALGLDVHIETSSSEN